MEATARDIESQLRSLFQITGTGMGMEPSQLSLILTSLPLDDSLKWTGVPCGSWRKVKKGEEGAVIEIEKL
jgi:predicted glutamine amidotransferase